MKTKSARHNGKYLNPTPVSEGPRHGDTFRILSGFLTGRKRRRPEGILQTAAFSSSEMQNHPPGELWVSWFGHSSVFLSVEGKTLLTDPVFSPRASMFRFAGPKRFHYRHDYGVDQLPELDAVMLSHDHYDHLDKATIIKLRDRSCRFFVPLGVGSILQKFGIHQDRIRELDWWEAARLDDLEITCTPAQHFSGRNLRNRMGTLWCAWVIRGQEQRVYFSGDSGYYQGFRETGEAFGPFDLALMECGAYSEYWPDIHMQPEQSVQAARDVRAKIVLPIHWGKFNLSLHPWKEPVERFLSAAKQTGLHVITPRPGAIVRVKGDEISERWWEEKSAQ